MNQVVYKQLEFNSRKYFFMFICLANKSISNPGLSSTIKLVKFKHNNVFVNNHGYMLIIYG